MIGKTGFCIVFFVAVIWFMCAMGYTYTTAIKDFIGIKRNRDKEKAAASAPDSGNADLPEQE